MRDQGDRRTRRVVVRAEDATERRTDAQHVEVICGNEHTEDGAWLRQLQGDALEHDRRDVAHAGEPRAERGEVV